MNISRVYQSTLREGVMDPFLMEPFAVEKNGMPLTVLSALARLGLDPWAEARRLTALPKQAAAAAIARHLALQGDPAAADRLAALLPGMEVVGAMRTESRTDRLPAALRRNVWLLATLWLAACVIFASITGPDRSVHQPAQPTSAPSPAEPAISLERPTTPLSR